MEKHLPTFLAFVSFVVGLALLLWVSGLVRPNSSGRRLDSAFPKSAKKPEQLSSRQSLSFELILSLTTVFLLGFLVLLPAAMGLKSKVAEGSASGAVSIGIFMAVLSLAIAYSRKKGGS